MTIGFKLSTFTCEVFNCANVLALLTNAARTSPRANAWRSNAAAEATPATSADELNRKVTPAHKPQVAWHCPAT